jgi:hypothetical protein
MIPQEQCCRSCNGHRKDDQMIEHLCRSLSLLGSLSTKKKEQDCKVEMADCSGGFLERQQQEVWLGFVSI